MLAEKLSAKIRLLRQAKNYTQENMAELLNMSVSGYAKLERGETDIDLSRIEQIAQIFEVPASEMININPGYVFYNHGTTNGTTTFHREVHVFGEKRLDTMQKQITQLHVLMEQLLKKGSPAFRPGFRKCLL